MSGRLWIAQRHGQDWRDEHILAAIRWFTSLVPRKAWDRRMAATAARFEAGRAAWIAARTPPYDPADPIAWLFFQANAYAAERQHWIEEEAYRIAPIFRRIGQDLELLKGIDGVEERGARLLASGNLQPDDGLFEFLVALAYRRAGWKVGFVPEAPPAKTPDLALSRGRQRWAGECKRAGRSGYAVDERARGEALASPVHDIARRAGRSFAVEVAYAVELDQVPEDYLADRASTYVARGDVVTWEDQHGQGQVRPVDWSGLQAVLRHDDLYVGSSRMIELLLGHYAAQADYSLKGVWRPSTARPFHAASMRQASVVGWLSTSYDAARRKASHFKSVVGKAARQLPGDRPGVVHVGYEARGGNSVDAFRHLLNGMEMRDFDPGTSRLRYVYGNYMMPEHTTARNEASAVSETTATYRIGATSTAKPLPNHVLLDDAPAQPGSHW